MDGLHFQPSIHDTGRPKVLAWAPLALALPGHWTVCIVYQLSRKVGLVTDGGRSTCVCEQVTLLVKAYVQSRVCLLGVRVTTLGTLPSRPLSPRDMVTNV